MIILWILLGIVGLVLILLLAAVIRTLLIPGRTSTYQPDPDPERAMDCAKKLSAMVRCETVSVPDEDQREKFLAFHKVLGDLFPLVHERLEKTEIDGNLLYCWKGREANRPLVLMSHQDVVPAEGKWPVGGADGGEMARRGCRRREMARRWCRRRGKRLG
jgi:carboxypeptidase PM20D1